jgi:hypothetical protein
MHYILISKSIALLIDLLTYENIVHMLVSKTFNEWMGCE